MAFKTFGEAFKAHRLGMRMSLRQFCQAKGFDPGNISRLERNLLPPPKEERLRVYAHALKLVDGTDIWYEFFDLAAASKGEFPEDLRDSELLTRLPALFRALRGNTPTDEQLDHIVARLRKR